MYNMYRNQGGETFPATALEFGGCTRDPRPTVYHITINTREKISSS